jgi:glycosyltransferase involved in cell wall biosynthesis
MKLHTVFITYNRLELTQQAVKSYLETVSVPFTFTIVDNNSTDGTQKWVADIPYGGLKSFHLLAKNRYPGYACNLGWSDAPKDATHLHRADNDFIFLPGWCEEVERCFGHYKKLGQLGMRTNDEELNVQGNTGGNCVVSRKLWDKGLRWDERPWPQIRDEVGAGWTEDSLISREVRDRGWHWVRVRKPCIQPISFESKDDEYYQQTWSDRGIRIRR